MRFFDQRIAKPLVERLPRMVKANHLSVARVFLVVPIIIWADRPWIALSALVASSLCDLFDGPLARLRGETSRFGALLDATGDKVFILGALFFACGDRVPLWIRLTIAALDVGLTLIRPIKLRLGLSVSANVWGGWKQWAQSIALGMVLSRFDWAESAAPFVFHAAIVFAAFDLLQHLRDCWKRDLAS